MGEGTSDALTLSGKGCSLRGVLLKGGEKRGGEGEGEVLVGPFPQRPEGPFCQGFWGMVDGPRVAL